MSKEVLKEALEEIRERESKAREDASPENRLAKGAVTGFYTSGNILESKIEELEDSNRNSSDSE